MIDEEVKRIEDERLAATYWKRPLTITEGREAVLIDSKGREYIDCTGNYGVAVVGHCHPRVVDAMRTQVEKLISCHGTFYNPARSDFLEKLVSVTPKNLDSVFLSNSGAESVEFALKLARKSTGKKEIIAMMGGFHGKTMGALSATWNRKYRTPFEPLVPKISHVPYGKIDRVKDSINEDTAAVIFEPIQGESGINIPPKDFIPSLRELCEEKEVLMIADEIQTGLGRTGSLFACEHYGVTPDIMCLAKALAGGLPMGATISSKEIMSSMGVGEHSSTFGGNPVSCAAASAVIDILTEENLPEKASRLGDLLLNALKDMENEYKIVRKTRGMGLMIGIELRFDILNILLGAMDKGVLFLDAGRNVVRLLPPLVINEEQIGIVASVLNQVLGDEEAARIRS
jgi:acetylornithine/LysW-gamma-L-lysine aminotransferase